MIYLPHPARVPTPHLIRFSSPLRRGCLSPANAALASARVGSFAAVIRRRQRVLADYIRLCAADGESVAEPQAPPLFRIGGESASAGGRTPEERRRRAILRSGRRHSGGGGGGGGGGENGGGDGDGDGGGGEGFHPNIGGGGGGGGEASPSALPLSRESLDAAAAFSAEFQVEDADLGGGVLRPATSALVWGAAASAASAASAAAAAGAGGGGGGVGEGSVVVAARRRAPLPEFETGLAGEWFRPRHHDSGDC